MKRTFAALLFLCILGVGLCGFCNANAQGAAPEIAAMQEPSNPLAGWSYNVAWAWPMKDTFHVVEAPLFPWSEQWSIVATAALTPDLSREFWGGAGVRYTFVRRVSKLPFDLSATAGAITRLDGVLFDLPMGWYVGVGFTLEDEPRPVQLFVWNPAEELSG